MNWPSLIGIKKWKKTVSNGYPATSNFCIVFSIEVLFSFSLSCPVSCQQSIYSRSMSGCCNWIGWLSVCTDFLIRILELQTPWLRLGLYEGRKEGATKGKKKLFKTPIDRPKQFIKVNIQSIPSVCLSVSQRLLLRWILQFWEGYLWMMWL